MNEKEKSVNSGTTGFSQMRKKKGGIYLNSRYYVKECIYKGLFHNTYKGIDIETKDPIIIKMCNQYHEHIAHEKKILKNLQNTPCIPKIIWNDEEKINSTTYFISVMQQLGPSLKMLFHLMNKQFSLATICLLASQVLTTLEEIHKQNIVHRNLKPRKIITHNTLKNLNLFIIDFKHSKKFRHSNGKAIKYSENYKLQNKVFCNKFSSIGTHLGISPSRKDDLESLGYILIYIFRKGKLWDSKKAFQSKDEKLKFYEDWKLQLIPENYINEMPQEFINYLNYVKSMNISDDPEYENWRKQFRSIISKQGISISEYEYEWVVKIKQDMVALYGSQYLVELENGIGVINSNLQNNIDSPQANQHQNDSSQNNNTNNINNYANETIQEQKYEESKNEESFKQELIEHRNGQSAINEQDQQSQQQNGHTQNVNLSFEKIHPNSIYEIEDYDESINCPSVQIAQMQQNQYIINPYKYRHKVQN